MSAQHTPTPWYVGNIGRNIHHNAASGYPFPKHVTCDTDEDAAFIVRACNAHDELVAALREARIFVGSMESDGAKIAMRQIESALAKAGAA